MKHCGQNLVATLHATGLKTFPNTGNVFNSKLFGKKLLKTCTVGLYICFQSW